MQKAECSTALWMWRSSSACQTRAPSLQWHHVRCILDALLLLAAGAILVLGRDLVMVPKLIHPLPPNSNGTPKTSDSTDDVEEEPPTPHPMTDTWMAAINEERPPTPPRGRPPNGPSLAFFE